MWQRKGNNTTIGWPALPQATVFLFEAPEFLIALCQVTFGSFMARLNISRQMGENQRLKHHLADSLAQNVPTTTKFVVLVICVIYEKYPPWSAMDVTFYHFNCYPLDHLFFYVCLTLPPCTYHTYFSQLVMCRARLQAVSWARLSPFRLSPARPWWQPGMALGLAWEVWKPKAVGSGHRFSSISF